MNCQDLKELLSAYADGELVGAQRDFIEEHLRSCADCRAILADYTKTREQLLSLRATPPIPDIKDATMSKIKLAEAPAKLRRWLRPALVGVPIIVALVTVLSLHLSGFFISPASLIAKAYAAVDKLESYRYTKDEYHQSSETSEPVHYFHVDFEYVSPDRYHLAGEILEEYHMGSATRREQILIGDQVYTYRLLFYLKGTDFYDKFTPTKEKTMGAMDVLSEIEIMPEGEIDGVNCFHYKGAVDIEKLIVWSRTWLEQTYRILTENLPSSYWDFDEYMKSWEDSVRLTEITYEFWIGKDDYLIRQWKQVYMDAPGKDAYWITYKGIAILKYYDFNEPILIEPPLTETGELLPGWRVTTLEE